ncbi:MAG: hypothetical protein ACREAO_00190 [Nitrososphaera sp.]
MSLPAAVGIGLAAGIAFIVLLSAAISNQVADTDRYDAWMPGDSQPLPEDFQFVYQYGIGLDYALDVESNGQGQFSAITCNSPTSVRHAAIALSQQDLEQIWLSIQENAFFGLTEDFTKECPDVGKCVVLAPSNRMTLEVQAEGQTKKVEFNQNYALNHNNAELDRFMQVVNTIKGVLDDYENLPESGCAYL